MSTSSMQELGPDNIQSAKVAWPAHLESTVCMLPNSFIPLLTTNLPPSSSDVSRIREYQASVLGSLAQERAKGHLKLGNDTYIRQLEKQSFACDVMLSPFRYLPNDILYRIAVHCPRYIRQPPHLSHSRVSHFPSVLAQVSRGWHNVLCGMSSIWSDIRAGSVHWHTEDIEALQKRCDMFARLCGLKVLQSNIDQPRDKALELNVLRVHALCDDEAQNHDIDDRNRQGHLVVHYLNSFPRLRHFSFDSLGLADLHAHHEMPSHNAWSALKTIHLTPSLSALDLWTLLSACSNLEVASLTIHVVWTSSYSLLHDETPSTICAHQAMKELELTFLSPESFEENFSLTIVQFPNLHTLAVEWCIGSRVLEAEDIEVVDASAFEDVFQAVETFEVQHMWTDLQQTLEFYLPILTATPSIRFVRILLFGLLQLQTALGFFEEHCPTTSEELLPRLEHLILEVSPGFNFDLLDEERRGEIASTVLMSLSSGNNVESDLNSNVEDEESGSQDVGGSYRTTVRYIWGKDRNEHMTELACFRDWGNRFPQVKGDTNVSSGVVVEVVKVQERDKYDIHEKEIFRRFES
ncbi:hypothetical protein BJ165DRAFT_1491548 [Panaeolus papilionaceus]|nr:hypothetical protein BJ165DRAFT_1491548 [Panaeolus papilionaceus]